MTLYKRVELEEGVEIQYLGSYALRWPFDSGVLPTVGFIEVDTGDECSALRRLTTRLAKAVLDARLTLLEADDLRNAATQDGLLHLHNLALTTLEGASGT